MKEFERFKKMFSPETIAVVGASYNLKKWGFHILHNILNGGYKGKVFPVNIRGEDVLGLKGYKSIKDIEPPIDLAIIVVPREALFDVLKDCVQKKVNSVFVVTAGFAELGEAGRKMQEDIRDFAMENDLMLGGPNGEGIVNARISLYAQMAIHYPKAGKLSMVSQSGNVGATMMQLANQSCYGFSKFISSGNEAVLKLPDYIDFFCNDDDTDVIVAYIEGIKDGKRLIESISNAVQKKRVIVIKGGKTEGGLKAAQSHTGAMTSDNAIFEAAIKQSGAIYVDGLQELYDCAQILVREPLPKGNRVGILTVGGGWGVLCADACEKYGLKVARLSENTLKKLDTVMPEWWARNNPVDSAGGGKRKTMTYGVEVLLQANEVDSVIVLGNALGFMSTAIMKKSLYYEQGLNMVSAIIKDVEMEVVEEYDRLLRTYNKPLVLSTDAKHNAYEIKNEVILALEERGIPVFHSPERAAKALSYLTFYAKKRYGW
ncbi:MAG: acetate--CoA ligase family protein [Myxococcota bacterium]